MRTPLNIISKIFVLQINSFNYRKFHSFDKLKWDILSMYFAVGQPSYVEITLKKNNYHILCVLTIYNWKLHICIHVEITC